MGSNLSLEEAVEMFPEIKEDLPKIIDELKSEMSSTAHKLQRMKRICLSRADQFWKEARYDDWKMAERLYFRAPEHKKFKQLSFNVHHIESFLRGDDYITPLERERANSVPMSTILGSHRKFYRCPFHANGNEKTASLHITGNKWYCHGCSQGGNTIGFVMKKYNLSFKSAVRAINSYNVWK
jgi:hypothetical protein